MSVAGVEKNNTQDLLVQKLHISAGFIDLMCGNKKKLDSSASSFAFQGF